MPICYSTTGDPTSNFDPRKAFIISVQGFDCDHWDDSRIRELFDPNPSEQFLQKIIRAHVYLCHR